MMALARRRAVGAGEVDQVFDITATIDHDGAVLAVGGVRDNGFHLLKHHGKLTAAILLARGMLVALRQT